MSVKKPAPRMSDAKAAIIRAQLATTDRQMVINLGGKPAAPKDAYVRVDPSRTLTGLTRRMRPHVPQAPVLRRQDGRPPLVQSSKQTKAAQPRRSAIRTPDSFSAPREVPAPPPSPRLVASAKSPAAPAFDDGDQLT